MSLPFSNDFEFMDFSAFAEESGETPMNEASGGSGEPPGGANRYLTTLAEELARQFKADRCTIYLYNEAECTYTMRAAYGYPMFGRATIVGKIGEGLTGRVLAERRPIYTETAASMRGYVPRPNFPDSEVQTFLGIPLLHGRDRVGAIVFRRRTGHPFLAEEISSMRTRASELTVSVQNANLLLMAEARGLRSPASKTQIAVHAQMVFRGAAVSNGWAMGPARIFKASPLLAFSTPDHPEVSQPELPPAIRSLDEAVEIVDRHFQTASATLEQRLPEAAAMLFEAGSLMLHDESYTGRIRALVNSGVPLTEAIVKISNEYISLFAASENEYIREKVHDVEDIAVHLLEAVTSDVFEQNDLSRARTVLITEKLLPSDVLRVARDGVSGIILCAGGATAHVTLLVRSLHIPMIIVKSQELLLLPENEMIIIDCANETVYVHPDEGVIRRFSWRASQEATERNTTPSKTCGRESTYTRDQERVTLQANINILADLDSAEAACAEGVGLYRTEFPFLMRQSMPSETEQLSIYSRILSRMPGKPVTFRTLDAGGDKVIPYLFKIKEDNPALGLRSIRFSMKYPNILDQQLRAILRAIQDTGRDDVSVMFPMISSIEEFRFAREHLETCLSDLHTTLGDTTLHTPFVGSMIEVPSILGVLDTLADECDFFSIGTNDLIQYLLAVDRTNAAVADCYVPHHPTVLRALKYIADVAIAHDTPLCICGEMGRDPKYLPFLIGIGIRQFSLEPSQITKAQELISCLTIEQCRQYAEDMLSMHKIADIEHRIAAFARSAFG